MSWLGNLLWFLLGGLVCGLGWIVAGVLLCATIIGIPVGFQLFKYAGLVFFPFGKIHPKKYNKKPFKISAKSKYLLQIENFLLFDQSKKEFKQIIKTTPIEEVDLSKFGLKIIQQ